MSSSGVARSIPLDRGEERMRAEYNDIMWAASEYCGSIFMQFQRVIENRRGFQRPLLRFRQRH